MSQFDARDLGLIDPNFDPYWRFYSYWVLGTVHVVSFYAHGFNPTDWLEWHREAINKKWKADNILWSFQSLCLPNVLLR